MPRTVTLPPDAAPTPKGIRAGGWWHESENDENRLVCDLCPRGCVMRPGDRGFCFVRENRGGELVSTTYGRSTGFCIDPIEKKPLFQFYPGTPVLSFGTAGCNLGCKFCQNWTSSRSRDVEAASERADPETIAEAARQLGCRSVAFTYNDPIVWAEYAIDTARACRAAGVKTVAVTSGYITPQARAAFYEAIDAANVDLKGFSDDFYRRFCAGRLDPVLDTLHWLARQTDTWLEITNLLIPGANDSADEIGRMCRWIVEQCGPDVPVHFSAFHPDFNLTDRGPTPLATLLAAHQIARDAGLRYVYTGNVHDPEHQHTYCPGCGSTVIGREGYALTDYRIRGGACTRCGHAIAGRFDDAPGDWGGRRQPVRIASFARPRPAASGAQEKTADSPAGPEPEARPARPELSPLDEQSIFRAAGEAVAATVYRHTAGPLEQVIGEPAAAPVYGAFVSLKRSGQLRSCCGFIGPSIPLAEALHQAAVRAARDDPRFPPISSAELDSLDMDVWLLWGLQPIGVRGRDRIGAVVIGRHGLQIMRGTARGLLLPGVAVDHHLDAESFLQQVCLKAGLPSDAWMLDDTALYTFEGHAIRGRLADAMRAGAPAGKQAGSTAQVRPPAVAGTFYPGRPELLRRMLDSLFDEPAPPEPQPWAAAIVPHAGWVYSGGLAARVLRRAIIPDRVIVMAPKHRSGGVPWAVAPHDVWSLPGMEVASDPGLARRLAEGVGGLELDAAPHREEHAIEVQLPLIARVRPDARVVGITIGGGGLDDLLGFGQQMAEVLRGLPSRPLLVVSTDMSHFLDDATARQLDRLAIEAVERLDPERVYQTVRENRITMCGLAPCVIVMQTLRQLGLLGRAELVGYTTSAAASGDTARVVGYAGMLLG